MTHTQASAPRRPQLVERDRPPAPLHRRASSATSAGGRHVRRRSTPRRTRSSPRSPTGRRPTSTPRSRPPPRVRRGPVAAAEARRERAAVLRRIAELHPRRTPTSSSSSRCLDIGMPIAQMRGLAARAAENFDYYAGVITELHGRRLPGRRRVPQLHDPQAGRRRRADHALERAADAVDVADRAGLAAGNTIVLKPAEWSPLTATRLAELMDEAGLPAGRLQRRARLRRDRRRAARRPSRRQPDLLHRRDDDRLDDHRAPARRRSSARPSSSAASRRSSSSTDCGSRPRRRRRVAQIFTHERPALHRRLAPARRRSRCTSELVEAVAARARNIRVGDPFDPRTELGPLIRPEHHERVLGYIDSARAGRRPRARRRRAAPTGSRDGNFLEATVIADVTPAMRVFQRGDLRPGPRGDAVRRRGGGDPARERDRVRARRLRLDATTSRAPTASRRRSTAGMCWINSQNVRDLRTPFGGVKASGHRPRGRRLRFEFYCELRDRPRRLGTHAIPRLGLPDDGGGRPCAPSPSC